MNFRVFGSVLNSCVDGPGLRYQLQGGQEKEMSINHDILIHHGIKGQKWGVRRYRNKDGSLTDEGKKRYGSNVNNDIDDYFSKEKHSDKENANFYKQIRDRLEKGTPEERKDILRRAVDPEGEKLIEKMPSGLTMKEEDEYFNNVVASRKEFRVSELLYGTISDRLNDTVGSLYFGESVNDKARAELDKYDKADTYYHKALNKYGFKSEQAEQARIDYADAKKDFAKYLLKELGIPEDKDSIHDITVYIDDPWQ